MSQVMKALAEKASRSEDRLEPVRDDGSGKRLAGFSREDEVPRTACLIALLTDPM